MSVFDMPHDAIDKPDYMCWQKRLPSGMSGKADVKPSSCLFNLSLLYRYEALDKVLIIENRN